MNDESALVKHLREGNQNAFEEVCRRYGRRLYAYCDRFTCARSDTEELVQDVFLELWNYRSSMLPDSSIEALLFTIARRKGINSFRSRINSPVFEDYVNYVHQLEESESDTFGFDELISRVRNIISTMPPAIGRVVEMSLITQLSNREIASQLSISDKSVRNRLSEGLAILRRRLTPALTTLSIVTALQLTLLSCISLNS
ncbi:MAG: sigma-70 family RNA polymerase sigma factor [Paramuribaculum sp.]|nr:sigma-70 family RNA polymerase sigma factor [Paramuribaculum sp.]